MENIEKNNQRRQQNLATSSEDVASDNVGSVGRRQIRSFVRREGKFSPRLEKAYAEFAPSTILRSGVTTREDLLRLANGRKIIVEIGSGQGNQLVYAAVTNMAKAASLGSPAEPDTLYIGLEVYRTGVAHTLLLARNEGVLSGSVDSAGVKPPIDAKCPQNLYLFEEDAAELFRSGLFDGLIDELWTFFPDPWPKKRHNKRRLVTSDFANVVGSVLKPGGVWRLATDWEDYAKQMQEVLQITPTDRFEGRVLTNFEKKGIAAGRCIFDFEYLPNTNRHCERLR